MKRRRVLLVSASFSAIPATAGLALDGHQCREPSARFSWANLYLPLPS